MSVQNALAGLQMINDKLDRRRQQDFEKDILAVKLKYQAEEKQREQAFSQSEGQKERANRVRLTQIQQGPEYRRIKLLEEEQKRKQAGLTAATEAFKQDIGGETPQGKILAPLLESGAMAPSQVVSAMPERSSLEWIAQLNGLAFSADTPEKATQYRQIADQAMTTYNEVKEQEAYRKRISEIKSKGVDLMDYNYDPAPVIPAAKELLKEKFGDEYDPQESLAAFFIEKKKKDPSFSREAVREELNAKLAQKILKTDPKLGGDYLRAFQAASALWEGFETGGIGSLLNIQNLDEEGEMTGTAKGWRPIPLRIEKGLFFRSESRKEPDQTNLESPNKISREGYGGSYFDKKSATPVADAGK